MEAVRDWQGRGPDSEEERLAWLRRTLAHNLLDGVKRFRAEKREVGRERSLEDSIHATMGRLGDMLASDASTPSLRLMRDERDLRIADALSELPDAHRAAVVRQRWRGWTLAEIGASLRKPPRAVAGLSFRAQQSLQRTLSELAP